MAELLRRAEASLNRGVGVVWVEGELAEWKSPPSGHAYFAVRERDAAVSMVMWRSDLARHRQVPRVGERVRVRGKLGVYPRDGRMQFYADVVEPAGAGEAAAALERLRAQLAAEGLMAESRKRPLPRIPRKVGVVTAAGGAAVHDILRTLARRFPVPVLIADTAVQGPSAPAQLVAALQRIVLHGVDVVIIGRGGGSAGDLAAFNDERVVRAVAACPVPVVSAVGHEVDLSLCDLVADKRASTPTAAAEHVVPVRAELAAALDQVTQRLHRDATRRLRAARQEVDHLELGAARAVDRHVARAKDQRWRLHQRLAAAAPGAQLQRRRAELVALERRLRAHDPAPQVAQARAELAAIMARGATAIGRAHTRRVEALRQAAGTLAALSPLAVLGRGFAVVRRSDQAAFVRAARELQVGDVVDVRVAAGSFAARVERVTAPGDEGDA